MRSNKRAYTFIELVIVVALVALVAAIAAPSIVSQLPFTRLNNAVWRIVGDLRSARLQSMSEGVNRQVSFDVYRRQYTIWSDLNRNGVRDVDEVVTNDLSDEAGVAFRLNGSSQGTFRADGTFVSSVPTRNWLGIRLYSDGTTEERSIVVWPSGQVWSQK